MTTTAAATVVEERKNYGFRQNFFGSQLFQQAKPRKQKQVECCAPSSALPWCCCRRWRQRSRTSRRRSRTTTTASTARAEVRTRNATLLFSFIFIFFSSVGDPCEWCFVAIDNSKEEVGCRRQYRGTPVRNKNSCEAQGLEFIWCPDYHDNNSTIPERTIKPTVTPTKRPTRGGRGGGRPSRPA
jgi:hypothetical protein